MSDITIFGTLSIKILLDIGYNLYEYQVSAKSIQPIPCELHVYISLCYGWARITAESENEVRK
jgi:hypothetical protein